MISKKNIWRNDGQFSENFLKNILYSRTIFNRFIALAIPILYGQFQQPNQASSTAQAKPAWAQPFSM
jgi:hypothetical protein